MVVGFGVKIPANLMVGGDDGAFVPAPLFLSYWSRRLLVAVDGCHAMRAVGRCWVFMEGEGCG